MNFPVGRCRARIGSPGAIVPPAVQPGAVGTGDVAGQRVANHQRVGRLRTGRLQNPFKVSGLRLLNAQRLRYEYIGEKRRQTCALQPGPLNGRRPVGDDLKPAGAGQFPAHLQRVRLQNQAFQT